MLNKKIKPPNKGTFLYVFCLLMDNRKYLIFFEYNYKKIKLSN